MSELVIKLPPARRHGNAIIEHCKWKIRAFAEGYAYVVYDYQAGFLSAPSNLITDGHVYATNSAMLARSPRKAWANFVGKELPELLEISTDLDLIDGSDSDVGSVLDGLGKLVGQIASAKGLTDMAPSKVLHLLRPRFIAISDSYVRACLGVSDAADPGLPRGETYARRLRAVQTGMRKLGQENAATLDELFQYANAQVLKDHPVQIDGKLVKRDVPVKLSMLRILDILLWADVAIHGHRPNPWLLVQYRREILGEA